MKSVGGLCEVCLLNGVYEPAVIIHHKVFLTPQNVQDPNISLNWSNLQAVCRKCHGEIHKERRYTVDSMGRVNI